MRAVPKESKHLVVAFARAPEEGRVKTRLGAEIGAKGALGVYLALAGEVWANQLQARARLGFQAWLAFDPPEAGESIPDWFPGADAYVPQSGGDLGARIENVVRVGFGAGFKSVLIIGTNAPDLSRRHYEEAFAQVRQGRAVVGPSEDGGFYLLALSAPPPDLSVLFSGIPWGSSETREGLHRKAARLGLDWVELEPLSDVDTLADLRRVRPGLLP